MSQGQLTKAALEAMDTSSLSTLITALISGASTAGGLKLVDWLRSRKKEVAEAGKIEAEAEVTLAEAWKIYADKQESRADDMAKRVLEMAVKIEALEVIHKQCIEKADNFEAQIDALQLLMRQRAAQIAGEKPDA